MLTIPFPCSVDFSCTIQLQLLFIIDIFTNKYFTTNKYEQLTLIDVLEFKDTSRDLVHLLYDYVVKKGS